MSRESVQFVEMVREHYAVLQYGKLERHEILLNIAEAVLNGEIAPEQARELRELYCQDGRMIQQEPDGYWYIDVCPYCGRLHSLLIWIGASLFCLACGKRIELGDDNDR